MADQLQDYNTAVATKDAAVQAGATPVDPATQAKYAAIDAAAVEAAKNDAGSQFTKTNVLPSANVPAPSIAGASVPAPTAQSVYSSQNITSAVNNPVSAPNLSDPTGLYDSFINSPEIQAARAAVEQGQQQINAVQQGLRTTTTALENQNDNAMGGTGASINLIGRQVGRARDLTANELAALGETQNAAIAHLTTLTADAENRYNIAKEERAQIQDLIKQTNGKAGISYTDSYEDALKKADKYQTKVDKDKKDQEYKDSLKQTLLSLGMKTKGSTKDLEKRLKSYYKDNKVYNDKIKQLDLQAKQKSVSGSSGSGKAGTSAELRAVSAAYTKFVGEWGKTASYLADQGYNVAAGSTIDNELRRRNGLAPVSNSAPKAQTQSELNSSINKQIGQISDWNQQSDENKIQFIRALGGDPADFGL